jgi:hypothetical protein
VGGAQDPEVAMIECCDSSGANAFRDGDQAGMAAAEGQIAVAVNEFTNAFPIVWSERFNMQGAVDDGIVESEFSGGSDLPVDHVCGLSDDHRGRDERPVVGFEEDAAGLVVIVVSIRSCDKDTAIND